MALTDTDRRRITFATAITLLALPALWLASANDGSSAPSVAVVGVDVGADAGAQTPSEAGHVLGEASPVFLDGPSSEVGAGQPVIAVPARPSIDGISARATFRNSIATASCIVPGVPGGARVTVVNVDNNRSITCTTMPAPDGATDVVLATTAFSEIGRLTDAPIAVEIRR